MAKFYGVETRIVNQAVKNNPEKFPKGYIMELSKDERSVLRSKILTLENHPGKGHYPKYLPLARVLYALQLDDDLLLMA